MQDPDAQAWGRFFIGLRKLPKRVVVLIRQFPGRAYAFLLDAFHTRRLRWVRITISLVVILLAGVQWGIPAWRHWSIRPAAGKPIFHVPVLTVISTSDPIYLLGHVWTSPEEWGVLIERPYILVNENIPYLSDWADSNISNKWDKLKIIENGAIGLRTQAKLGFKFEGGMIPGDHINDYRLKFEGHSETTTTSKLGGESLWFPTRWVRTHSVIFKGNLKVFCGDELLVEQASNFVDPMQEKIWILYNGKYILFTDFPYFEWGKDGKSYYHFYLIKVPHPKLIDWDNLAD